MVEMVDSEDLGDVTLVIGFCAILAADLLRRKYAGMMELADMRDLGDVTSVKIFLAYNHIT